MQIKTFHAPDLASALARARAELGPDALVLATNEMRGRLGLTSIEITVAVDRKSESETGETTRLRDELIELRQRLHASERRLGPVTTAGTTPARRHLPPGTGTLPARSHRPPATAEAPTLRAGELPAALRAAVEALVRAGLSRDLALRFARSAARDLGAATDTERLAAATTGAMGELLTFAERPLESRVLFVVGPPGAGKSTTVAKLAARAVLDDRTRIVLAQADTERVGALEQSRVYARHLELELVAVHDPKQLSEAQRLAGPRGTVLVDTAGIGARDLERLDALLRLRSTVPEARVALLLPAGLHRLEARRVLQRFAPLEPSFVAISRVDDAARPGELVTAVAQAGLPLGFLTNGHRVPDDLQEATPRTLAALLLRSGCHEVAQRGIST
jgi:flagellar biosynthesis protein FlhF